MFQKYFSGVVNMNYINYFDEYSSRAKEYMIKDSRFLTNWHSEINPIILYIIGRNWVLSSVTANIF